MERWLNWRFRADLISIDHEWRVWAGAQTAHTFCLQRVEIRKQFIDCKEWIAYNSISAELSSFINISV